jgi:hypothetical protein
VRGLKNAVVRKAVGIYEIAAEARGKWSLRNGVALEKRRRAREKAPKR